jgi:GTPase SAR1 family protein
MEIIFIGLGIIIIISLFSIQKQRKNVENNDRLNNLRMEIEILRNENERLKRQNILANETPQTKNKSPENISGQNKLPSNFILTDDFRSAFNLMENTNYSIFITGKAGTGKSTLIEYFRIHSKKKYVVLAPTGIAALNIGGKTIHSFFKFPPQVVTSDQIKDNTYRSEIQEIFKYLNTIIIDEISMARADVIEGIDYILKKFRDEDKPFGGVQLICVGDLYQLPPVISKKDNVTITYDGEIIFNGLLYDYFERKYKGHYFFNSDAFKDADFKYCLLNTIFRQKDDNNFMNILNAIRENNITNDLLKQLNDRFSDQIKEANDEIVLCTTNAAVDSINKKRMRDLITRAFIYEAIVTGVFETEFDAKDYPVEKQLILKENAQVMFTKNDKEGRWVNGTIGTVKELANDKIDININGTTFTINQETWEAIDYEYDEKNDKLISNVIGTFTQYPLKLAWAITIHKSQGKTFEKVIIDLGNGAFAHGQTYVALSRCKTLNGIKLKKLIKQKDIILDDKVVNFIKQMNNKLIIYNRNNGIL